MLGRSLAHEKVFDCCLFGVLCVSVSRFRGGSVVADVNCMPCVVVVGDSVWLSCLRVQLALGGWGVHVWVDSRVGCLGRGC